MTGFRRITITTLKLAAVVTVLTGSLGLGVAQAAETGSTAAPKPTPVAPMAARNIVTAPLATKPRTNANIVPLAAPSVILLAGSTSLWPTQSTTLTAISSQDVGPTPYYLGIYDTTTGAVVALCASGTACSGSVMQTSATTHNYRAYVASYSTANPPPNVQAASAYVTVVWRSITVSLRTNPTTTLIGGVVTLTAYTSQDVGPTPFYTQVFDMNTGTRVLVCGGGTTCTGTTTQFSTTTHKFVAYVASSGTTLPLSNVQAASVANFATWANAGHSISSLSTTRIAYGLDTITATSGRDVTHTPYYIEIFNVDTGARIAACGTGTICSVNVYLSPGNNNFVAFISSYGTALPPFDTQASSSVIGDTF